MMDIEILDHFPYPVCITNSDKVILYCNNQFASFECATAKDIIGLSLSNLKLSSFESKTESGSVGNGIINANQQRYVVQKAKAIINNEPCVISTYHHIEFLEDELLQSLHEKENEIFILREILSVMPGHVYWLDKNLKYLGCNLEQAKAAGLDSVNEIIGKTNKEMIWYKDAEELDKINQKVLETGQKYTQEEVNRREGQENKIFLTKKTVFKDEQGKTAGVLGISFDITDKKKLESELIKRNEELLLLKEKAEAANKAKSTFIANISHDIRTPLSGIISVGDAMVASPEELTTGNVQDMLAAAHALLNMQNRILDFIRVESPDFRELQKEETFSIASVINDVIALYTPSANISKLKLKSNIADNIPEYIITKPTFIHKILVNLIGNAIKFTKEGYVAINVWYANETEPMLYFSVSDTGEGIPDDKKDKVFEWFEKLTPSYKGTHHGTGLGLAMVRKAVDGLGGNITVSDNEDGGTVFTCELPIKIPEKTGHLQSTQTKFSANEEITDINNLIQAQQVEDVADSDIDSKQASEVIAGKHLLLIEDSKIAGKGALMMLKKAGFSVDWVETGESGIAQILTGKHDIVIADIGLPDMNGDKVVLEARKAGASMPIYALTGHAAVDREELLDVGFTDVMVKPLNLKLFLKLMLGHGQQQEKVAINKDAVIDLSLANDIGLDRESAKEMLEIFIETLDSDKQELKQGIAMKNVKKLRDTLHKLRGGATYACVPKLSAVMKQVHEDLKEKAMSNKPIDFDEHFRPLFLAMDELKQAYQKQVF